MTIDDCPRGMSSLCQSLEEVGVTVKDIRHDRAWLKDIYKVEVGQAYCIYLCSIETVVSATFNFLHFTGQSCVRNS